MAEASETGIKWWMRYVIVPIIGGGGIVAILIAIIDRPRAPVMSQPTAITKPAPDNVPISAPSKPDSPKPVEDGSSKQVASVKKRTRPSENPAILVVWEANWHYVPSSNIGGRPTSTFKLGDQSLGTHPTTDIHYAYVVWNVENPQNKLSLICTEGIGALDESDARIVVPPTGKHLVWTKLYNVCSIEEMTKNSTWKELARVRIYPK